MAYDPEARTKRNLEALAAPKVGDWWEDRMVKILLVVKVTENAIHVVRTKPYPKDPVNYCCWNYDAVEIYTPVAFTAYLRYDHREGTWADVHRGQYVNDIPDESEWTYTDAAIVASNVA